MNFVFLSPHFPPNFYLFCVQLNNLGVNVLGLADEPYHLLHPALKSALREYYRVNNMHNYDELLRAMGFLTFRHGRLDRLDSQNEYWLETEARLRDDFNIFGMHTSDMPAVKRKSVMKEMFTKAGVAVARGRIVHTLEEAKELVEETGYPVVAKPDIGVGAADTYKINNDQELATFFERKPAIDFIMEEFISGIVCTFDGLTDFNGNLVFYTSEQYNQGIMETVNNDGLFYDYSLREIPPDLEAAGRSVLKGYNVRERFFHFEFFRTSQDNRIVALEVNMRPPGGMTTDMFNYANDIDIYKEWANIIVNNRFSAEYTRKYHCAYIGRKSNRCYAHSHEQILANFGPKMVHCEPVSGVFSAALGDYGYLVRSPDLSDIHEMADYIQKLA
jgi:hypothetical protein